MADFLKHQKRHESVALEVASDVSKGIPVIDSLLRYCEANGITPEELGQIIKRDPILLQKVTDEAVSHNMLKGIAQEQTLGDFFD